METQLGSFARGSLEAGAAATVPANGCGLADHQNGSVLSNQHALEAALARISLIGMGAGLSLWRHSRGVVHATCVIVLTRVDCVTVHFCHAGLSRTGVGPRPDGRRLARRVSALLSREWRVPPSVDGTAGRRCCEP
jgi:hypothetical protein